MYSSKEGLDLKNCIQVQSLIVKSNRSRELYLGTEFISKEEWIQRIVNRYKVQKERRLNLENCKQVQGLEGKKNGSRKLYLGTGFNSKEKGS